MDLEKAYTYAYLFDSRAESFKDRCFPLNTQKDSPLLLRNVEDILANK